MTDVDANDGSWCRRSTPGRRCGICRRPTTICLPAPSESPPLTTQHVGGGVGDCLHGRRQHPRRRPRAVTEARARNPPPADDATACGRSLVRPSGVPSRIGAPRGPDYFVAASPPARSASSPAHRCLRRLQRPTFVRASLGPGELFVEFGCRGCTHGGALIQGVDNVGRRRRRTGVGRRLVLRDESGPLAAATLSHQTGVAYSGADAQPHPATHEKNKIEGWPVDWTRTIVVSNTLFGRQPNGHVRLCVICFKASAPHVEPSGGRVPAGPGLCSASLPFTAEDREKCRE